VVDDNEKTTLELYSCTVSFLIYTRDRQPERESVLKGVVHSTVTRICRLTDGGTPLDATHS